MEHETPLRAERKRRGLSIAQVSAAIGIDPGNLSRIERGWQIPGREVAAALADYYQGAINELQIIYPERYLSSVAVEDGHA